MIRVKAKSSAKMKVTKVKKATYQWFYRPNPQGTWQSVGKSGTKYSLSVKATMALNGYQYRCATTSAAGVTYSDIYELSVYEPLKVTKQPKWAKTSQPGEKVTLTITATGAESYQWFTRTSAKAAWTKIDGATGTSYVVEVQEGMAGWEYKCDVTGKAGTVASKAAKVKLAKPPKAKITKQPSWKTKVQPGDQVTLTLTAANAQSYQWYYRANSKDKWHALDGETGTTLTFTVQEGTNGYQYRCAVVGKANTVYSKTVTLKFQKS